MRGLVVYIQAPDKGDAEELFAHNDVTGGSMDCCRCCCSRQFLSFHCHLDALAFAALARPFDRAIVLPTAGIRRIRPARCRRIGRPSVWRADRLEALYRPMIGGFGVASPEKPNLPSPGRMAGISPRWREGLLAPPGHTNARPSLATHHHAFPRPDQGATNATSTSRRP